MQNSLRGSGSAAHLRRPPLPGPVPMNARVLAQLAGCGAGRDGCSPVPRDVYMLGCGGVRRAWRAALHVRPSCMRPRVCCLHGHAVVLEGFGCADCWHAWLGMQPTAHEQRQPSAWPACSMGYAVCTCGPFHVALSASTPSCGAQGRRPL